MPDAVDLGYAFGLPPKEAIAYFIAKGFLLNPDGWAAVEAEAHNTAFTVARVAVLDILQDIYDAVQNAIEDGTTFRQFSDDLEPLLIAKGWWGRTEAGVELGSPYRLATIFRTNLQTAYMKGREEGMRRTTDSRPWWQYVAVLDERTRPAHRSMNGKVFRFDDPIWRTCRPPWGYNCRCRIRNLSDAELQRKGIIPESSDGRLIKTEVQVQGYTQPVAGYRDPVTGRELLTDPGWGYDRRSGFTPDPAKYAMPLRALISKTTPET